jgi:hypothetical protein
LKCPNSSYNIWDHKGLFIKKQGNKRLDPEGEQAKGRAELMNIPIMIGWQQVVFLIVAIAGLGMLLSALMSATRGRVMKYVDKDGRVHYHHHRRERLRAGRGLGGLLLVVLAVSLLWVTYMAQSYLGLNADIPAARVHATTIEGLPHHMSVELTQFNRDGKQTSSKTYLLKGDRWQLQANMLKFPTWLNMLGLHSGYKVTRLQGQYDDPELERKSEHSVYLLNGGEDDFFKTAYKQAWTSPFVEAAYGNAVILPADGLTYNVFVSQTGLYAKPAK